MISIFVGLLFIGVGFWGLLSWYTDLWIVVKGLGPVSLLLGGIIGVMAGVTSLRDRRKNDGSK